MERFQRLVFAIAGRAGLSEEDKADVFQQSFVMLFENIHRLDDPSRVGAWLATTARRESWRASRKSRQAPVTSEAFEDVVAAAPDGDDLPGDELAKLETQHEIRTMVERLDDRCRRMVQMLFYRNQPLAYADVAVKLGIPEGSIGPTRARCLNKLRKMMKTGLP